MIRFRNGFYADIRTEDRFRTTISYKAGILEELKTRREKQAFLRVYDGKLWYYASVTDLDHLQKTLDGLYAAATENPDILNDPVVRRFERNVDHIETFTDCSVRDVPLKKKQDLGADFITTQLTYDMDQFRRWLDQVRAAGIDLPVAVGVMPVLDRDKCIRYCISMNGSAIPRSLARLISKYYDDPEGFRDAGMDYTVRQMYEYLSIGIQDLHIFTRNQSEAMNEILKRSGLFSENGR